MRQTPIRAVIAAAAIGTIVGCSSAPEPAAPAPTTTLPAYKMSDDGKHTVTIATAATDPVQWRAMFDQARASHTSGDGWLVSIECPGTAAGDGRPKTLATGAFANTQKGLAVTGLASVDATELKATGLTCI